MTSRKPGHVPNTFTVIISDDQRRALAALIKDANADKPGSALEYWEAMLEQMPADEADHPHMIHGLCL